MGETVIFTGSNRGEMRPCGCPGAVYGGLAKRATMLHSLREQYPDSVLVDAGDSLFPDEPLGASTRPVREQMALGILNAMQAMAYDHALFSDRDRLDEFDGLRGHPFANQTPSDDRSMGSSGVIQIVTLTDEGWSEAIDPNRPTVGLTALDDAEIAAWMSADKSPSVLVSSSLGATLSEPLLSFVNDVLVVRPTPKGKELGVIRFYESSDNDSMGETDFSTDGDGVTSITVKAGRLKVGVELQKIPRETEDDAMVDALLRDAEVRAEQAGVAKPWEEWSGQTYVGVTACVGCHPSQTEKWAKSRHSMAWAALQSDGSDANLSCLECHSTGKGEEGGFLAASSVGVLQDVQCEECHGPGLQHAYEPTEYPPPIAYPGPEVCAKCHTSERTKKTWSYEWAVKWAGCKKES